MSKDKLIPEIRFPEFINKEDWKVKTIDELCDILNNIRKPISSGDRKKGSYPYYGASGIIDYVDNYLFDESLLLIGEDGAKWGAYENTAFLVEGKYWVNNHAHVLKPKLIKDKLLESYLVKLDLHPYITGAAPPKLTLGKLKEIPVPVPENDKEQQKIASCLASLDEVIAAHSQKLGLLKDHKKGLMQNLFPQEGEKVPKYRFKEFEDDGEWVETTLGSISSKIMVGIASAATHAYRNKGIILFRNQNIKKGYLDDKDILYIDEEYEREHKNKRLKAGDLLTARTGYPGTTCVVPEKYEGSQSFTTLITRPKQNIINPVFLSYYINSEKGQAFFNATKIGGGQQNVNAGSLTDMSIIYPSKTEQQKIASCLSSLDTLITAQKEKIEQLKLHKKGLMQGLFPKIKD